MTTLLVLWAIDDEPRVDLTTETAHRGCGEHTFRRTTNAHHRVYAAADDSRGDTSGQITVADEAVEMYRTALRAWAAQDLRLATELATEDRSLDLYYERLMGELKVLEGPDAVSIAMAAFAAGRAIERIADHSAIIGARLRYLITGEPAHLAAEVR